MMPPMRLLPLLAGVACAFAVAPAALAADTLDPAVQRQLHRTLQQAVAAAGVPGAVAGVWVGDRGWEDAVGAADGRTGAPLRTDATLRIGSITKTFTATVLLQLADQGRL